MPFMPQQKILFQSIKISFISLHNSFYININPEISTKKQIFMKTKTIVNILIEMRKLFI